MREAENKLQEVRRNLQARDDKMKEVEASLAESRVNIHRLETEKTDLLAKVVYHDPFYTVLC